MQASQRHFWVQVAAANCLVKLLYPNLSVEIWFRTAQMFAELMHQARKQGVSEADICASTWLLACSVATTVRERKAWFFLLNLVELAAARQYSQGQLAAR